MPNPKGNPNNIKKYKFKKQGDEPLIGKISLRVTADMERELKAIENYPEFCRRAISEALQRYKDDQAQLGDIE